MGLGCVATRLFALANQVRCPASAYHKMGRGMQLLTTLVITAIIAKAAGRQKTLLEIRDLGALEGCGDLLGGDFSCPGHANGSALACQLLNRNMGVDLCFQTPKCAGLLWNTANGWVTLKTRPSNRQHRKSASASSNDDSDEVSQQQARGCQTMFERFPKSTAKTQEWVTCDANTARSAKSYECSRTTKGVRSANLPLVKQCVRTLLGIFTVASEYQIRNRFRRHFRFSKLLQGGQLDSLGCGINPVFVTATPGPELHEPPDVVVLQTRESMNSGKSFHWLRWATEHAPTAHYIFKMDTDTQICVDALQTQLGFAFAARAQWFGFFITGSDLSPTAINLWNQQMGDGLRPGQGYMSGAIYGLSFELASKIATSPWAATHVEGHEDVQMGLMAYHVAPDVSHYHLACLYDGSVSCSVRHRQFNKLHASSKSLCDEQPDATIASCDCMVWVEDDRDPVIGSLQGREFCDLAHGFGLQKPKDPRCAPGCRRVALGKKRAGFPKQEFCFGNMTRIAK